MDPKPNTLFRLPRSGTHIASLDGLRGTAILLVMISHFAGGLQLSKLKETLLSGSIGVDLFFVLSGFLITRILLDSKNGRYYFRNFYIRRGLRIFPLYYSFLIAFLFVLPRLHWTFTQFQSVENQSLYWSYLINFSIGIHGWPTPSILGHFWTLAIEEQFYLFWPMIIFLFRRKNLMLICCVCFLGCLVTRILLFQHGFVIGACVLTPARIDALIMGAFLSIMMSSPKGVAILYRVTWPLFGILTLALIALFLRTHGLKGDNPVIATLGLTIIPLYFAIILFLTVTASSQVLSKVFSCQLLRFFGHYSYSLYIFHHPIAAYLFPDRLSVEMFSTMVGSEILGFVLYSIAITIICLAFSLMSWYLLESPMLRLKRFFPYDYDTGSKKVLSA